MGLLALVKAVQQRFADEGTTATVVLDDAEVGKQVNQGPGGANRVVFVPIGGPYGPARNPGRNPRPLRTWLVECEVHCWGVDTTALSDPFAQVEAVWKIHDATIRAIHLAAHGTYQLTKGDFGRTPVERRYGKTIVFGLSLEVPILDTPYQVAPPGTEAVTAPTLVTQPTGEE